MSQSIIETALADLVTELEAITEINGYRNTVNAVHTDLIDLDRVKTFPELAIVFNDGRIDAIDNNKTNFQEFVEIGVFGYVKVAGSESLIHDLKKCLSQFAVKNINDVSKRYIIYGKENLFKIFRILPTDEPKGIVGIVFTLMIRYQDYTFE